MAEKIQDSSESSIEVCKTCGKPFDSETANSYSYCSDKCRPCTHCSMTGGCICQDEERNDFHFGFNR